jgi:hypothetical protein
MKAEEARLRSRILTKFDNVLIYNHHTVSVFKKDIFTLTEARKRVRSHGRKTISEFVG